MPKPAHRPPVKALTVCQPYAHLIAIGEKPIENRIWPTAYRGPLLIHAGKSRDWMGEDDAQRYPGLAFGAIVAVVDLVECLEYRAKSWPVAYEPLHMHEHANGPWCWVLARVRRLEQPIPCPGARQLWVPPEDIEGQVWRALDDDCVPLSDNVDLSLDLSNPQEG